MSQSDLFKVMEPNNLYTTKDLSAVLDLRITMMSTNLRKAMRIYPIFRVYLKNKPFYVLLKKTPHKFKDKKKDITNRITMVKI